ncbi:MAG: WecB/TagA/CpsF family glycosyltransferase [Phycisphaerales bacterium]
MTAAAPPAEPPRVTLAGAWVHAITMQRALDHIEHESLAGRGGWVVTPNLDILHKLVHDEAFAALVAPASLRLPDGMPLVWASRIQGTPLPERVAGSDLVGRLAERAATAGLSVFLLGGDEGVAEMAAEVLIRRHPGLRIAGVECPPFGFERDEGYLERLTAMLREAKPDIVFVGLGCPKQERLIDRLRHELPSAWFLGIGISFSFLAGRVQRAPGWMQRVGLEWAHRLAQEPGRLAHRYLVVGIPFVIRLLVSAATTRIRERPTRPNPEADSRVVYDREMGPPPR